MALSGNSFSTLLVISAACIGLSSYVALRGQDKIRIRLFDAAKPSRDDYQLQSSYLLRSRQDGDGNFQTLQTLSFRSNGTYRGLVFPGKQVDGLGKVTEGTWMLNGSRLLLRPETVDGGTLEDLSTWYGQRAVDSGVRALFQHRTLRIEQIETVYGGEVTGLRVESPWPERVLFGPNKVPPKVDFLPED